MGRKRTVVLGQRRVLGDGWEIKCVSRSSADKEKDMSLLLWLWPAMLIDMGAHNCSSLLMESHRQLGGHNDRTKKRQF